MQMFRRGVRENHAMSCYPSIRTARAECRALMLAQAILSAFVRTFMLLMLTLAPGKAAAAQLSGFTSGGCEPIVGTWEWFNGATVECFVEGRCKATNGFGGSWACLDPAGRVEIRWSRDGRNVQYVDTLEIASGGRILRGSNQLGGRVTARRAVDVPPVATGTSRDERVAPRVGETTSDGELARASLSKAQQETVKLFGWPDAFSVQRINEENGPARYEAWTWFDTELTYVFMEGEFRFVEPASGLSQTTGTTYLRPTSFLLGASVAEVKRLSAGSRWERVPPLFDLPGVSLFLAEDFIAGFHEGALIAIDTQLPQTVGEVAQ